MFLYILIILLVAFLLISLAITKNLFSALSIFVISYLLSALLILPNVDLWDVNLHNVTFRIILLGVANFFIGYLISYIFFKNHRKEVREFKKYQVDITKQCILIIFQIITLLLNFYAVNNIVGGISIKNFSNSMALYRNLTAYSENVLTIPAYINQMVNIVHVVFYFVSYIFFENYFYNKKNNSNGNIYFLFIFSIIINIIICLLSAGRYSLIASSLGIFILFTVVKSKDKDKIGKTFFLHDYIKIICIFVIVLFLFSISRFLVGRTNTNGFAYYIASYFGGSIPLLDKLVMTTIRTKPDYFGYNTFFPLYRILNKLGLVDSFRRGNLQFMQSGDLIGNVYTSFSVIYLDFGMLGVALLSFLEGMFWGTLYQKVYIKKYNQKKSIIIALIYCLHIYSVFLHSYSETFYSTIFSQSFVMEVLYLYLFYFFFFEIKFV